MRSRNKHIQLVTYCSIDCTYSLYTDDRLALLLVSGSCTSEFVVTLTFYYFSILSSYQVESLCLFFSPFYSALDCFVQIGNHLERSLYNLVENASCSEHLCTHVRHCLFSFASFELSVGCRGHRGIWVIASRQITCIFFALLLNS